MGTDDPASVSPYTYELLQLCMEITSAFVYKQDK